MLYYSEISQSEISEQEAIKQIIDLYGSWYQMARPSQSFICYLQEHPQLLNVEAWNCFQELN